MSALDDAMIEGIVEYTWHNEKLTTVNYKTNHSRYQNPKRLIIAIPVAPKDTVKLLKTNATT